MVELSYGAQRTLDQYLRQVKAYLHASQSVDATDVEQSIHEHIETELEGRAEPVSADQLADVLKKLGRPQQWVPDEELPWWRRALLGLQVGPEDWRLAYLSFGLLLLGLVGFTYSTLFWVFVLGSCLAARAGLSAASDLSELKAQKWLLYPGLLVLYVPFFVFIMSWPTWTLCAFAFDIDQFGWLHRKWLGVFGSEFDTIRYWMTVTCIVTAVTALWWIMAGLIALKRLSLIKSIFHPFADQLDRRKIRRFVAIAFVVFMLGSIFIWLYASHSPPTV
jgi:hypothetical protein